MRLPQLSKTQKKVAIGAGAGLGLAALTWFLLRKPSSSTSNASTNTGSVTLTAVKTVRANASTPPADPTNRIVKQNTRVLAWPSSSNKNGMAYIKFTENGHVRGGWVSDMAVLRDSEQTPWSMPAPVSALGFSGLGALQVQVPVTQQQEANAQGSSVNATVINDSLMFLHPEDKATLEKLQKQYFSLVQLMGSGNGLVIPDEATFRKIYTHKPAQVLSLIPSLFYKDNKFTKDNLTNHSWCQTWAAQVVGWGNDYLWPFYNNAVYRYPPNVTPDPNLDRYPNSPIDPVKDNAAYEAALNASIEGDIQAALQRASFGALLDQIEQIMGTPAFGIIFGKDAPRDVFIMEMTPDILSGLARFGYDFASDNDALKNVDSNSRQTILNTVNGNINGKQISGKQLDGIRASVGAYIASGVIDMFESHNTDPKKGVVNPCIRELDAGLVVSMLIAVVSAFLAVVSLGSAGLLGPVIQAVYWSFYTAPSAIKGLADLSK